MKQRVKKMSVESKLQTKIDTLRVSIKYQAFDLESTRREFHYKLMVVHKEKECLEVENELLRSTLKKVIRERDDGGSTT